MRTRLLIVFLLLAISLTVSHTLQGIEGQRRSFVREYSHLTLLTTVLPLQSGYLAGGVGDIPGEELGHPFITRLNDAGSSLWSRAFVFDPPYGDLVRKIFAASDGYYFLLSDSADEAFEPTIVKFSLDGHIIWKRVLAFPGDDRLHDACRTPDGGVIIVGMTNSFGDTDAWIVRLDSAGNVKWSKTFGGDQWDSFYGVVPSGEGFIVVGGVDLFVAGPEKGIILKLGQDGSVVWQKDFAIDQSNMRWLSVVDTADNAFVVAGAVYPRNCDCSQTGLVKINQSGAILWQRVVGSASLYQDIEAMAQAPEGGAFLAGRIQTPDKMYGLVMRFDQKGNARWSRKFGSGLLTHLFYSIASTGDGGFIATGVNGHPIYPDDQISYGAAIVSETQTVLCLCVVLSVTLESR